MVWPQMDLVLRTRVERIGNRDIEIMEVTRTEYLELRVLRWLGLGLCLALIVFSVGLVTIAEKCVR